MTILRAAALAAMVAWAGTAHADGLRRFHDESGLLVGIGILADFLGASVLVDMIAPPAPETVCVDGYDPIGTAPSGDARPVDVGMRYSTDRRSTCLRW